ncbi:hypothetical protein [Salimicrobium humidisoli]|uniref:Hook-length control protein FliK n=1 Tax=Salimicrobium humidisoli TaxID=2029857 RepID=A0ABX4HS02_9BACI|nr:hypothetical protein [Salimicrobium humidisoli]PBB05855.1 hypothetical protein CKW00_06390 [Salimicrobium humidisoli]
MSSIMDNLFQSIQKIHKQAPISLSNGKVVKGKVIDLLPGNRAVVDIGQKQINARLETSLTKGGRYLFQVDARTTPVRLKVVSEQTGTGKDTPLQTWMNERGIKTNRQSMALVKTLINKQIPFTPQELRQAVTILQNEKTGAAMSVIEDMFEKQLPIRTPVFQALAAGKQHQLSELFRALGEGGAPFSPASRASLLVNSIMPSAADASFEKAAQVKLLQEVQNNSRQSFQLFKQAGILPETETYAQFKKKVLLSIMGESDGKSTIASGTGKQISPHIVSDMNRLLPITGKHPFSADLASGENEVVSGKNAGKIQQLFNGQLHISSRQFQQLKGWKEQLNKIVHSEEPASRALLEAFVTNHRKLEKAGVFQKVAGKLSVEEGASFRSIMKQLPGEMANLLEKRSGSVSEHYRSSVMNEAIRTVERSAGSQVPPHFTKLLSEWTILSQKELPLPLQERILLQMKAFQQLSGMDDEATLNQGRHTSDVSLKSSLVRLITENGGQRAETARNLLQMFNSMQITSSQDSALSLQLTLQFPGQLLGAREDAHVLLESEKTETGAISPDNCHILFYLDLQSLNETVIDMQVQNRKAYVTVYNDKEALPRIAEELKSDLREGMEKAGYSLGDLQIKQDRGRNDAAESNFLHKKEQGVDFRI